MTAADLTSLLASGEELYKLLLTEAETLLRNFDTNSAEDFEQAVACRERIMVSLGDFNGRLSALASQDAADGDAGQLLSSFRRLQEESTKKIVELDSLVIALARERLVALGEEMSALARGRSALHGYEGGREEMHNMSRTA